MSNNLKTGLTMGTWTFALAILVTSFSRAAVSSVNAFIAFIVLLFIICVGIIFDTIGVAAAAADEAPFNARAARKQFGAKKGLYLVKNADRVATICSDIVGDICGTVSGALGALLVFRLVQSYSANEAALNLVMIAAIAALTVGGKGYSKGIGIKSANNIISFVGNLLSRLENLLFWRKPIRK